MRRIFWHWLLLSVIVPATSLTGSHVISTLAFFRTYLHCALFHRCLSPLEQLKGELLRRLRVNLGIVEWLLKWISRGELEIFFCGFVTNLLKWASANLTAACVGSSEFVNTSWWVAGCLQRIYLSVLVVGSRDLVINIDLIMEVYY